MNYKDLLKDLKRVDKKLDKPVSRRDYKKHGKYSLSTFRSHFGSWTEAKEKIGIKECSGSGNDVSKSELLDDLLRVSKEIGERSLTVALYNELGDFSHMTLVYHFGSWNKAKEKAGLETINVGGTRVRKIDVKDDIIKVFNKYIEDIFSFEDYEKHGKYGQITFYKFFDDWVDALKECGIYGKVDVGRRKVSNKELLDDLRKSNEKVDGSLTSREYDIVGNYALKLAQLRFGSWNNAKKAAGICIKGDNK